MSHSGSKQFFFPNLEVRPYSERHRGRTTWALALVLALLGIALPYEAFAQRLITAADQRRLVSKPGTPAVGSDKADVTIIEYLDYNCPVCKKLQPTLRSLLAEDHNVAIVYKDWAILGDVSVYAARSALAAKWEGQYLVAHDALMAEPSLDDSKQVNAALKRAGIDLARLERERVNHAQEIDALIQRNNSEAEALGFKGTPGLLVGRQVVSGSVDLNRLKQLVAQARSTLADQR